MSETICTYPDRDDLLMAYLYDEIEPAPRKAFMAHVSACGQCARELAALRGVRLTLSAWAPPEPARALTFGEPVVPAPVARTRNVAVPAPAASRSWHDVPAWAQVVAALLVLGVSAAIANVEVRRDNTGWTLRTGWQKPVAVAPVAPPVPPTPWRTDLTALEQELRGEIRAARPAASTVTVSDADLQRRVRSIIDESERRQERELALRVAEVVRDVNNQRQADLVKIDRSLGLIQSSTYGEQMKQRELVNYLLKVSQKQ
jgi:hypothetical protein